MQRRRRPKAAPKDIFGGGSQTKSTKKELSATRNAPSTVPKPAPAPPPTVGIKPEPLPAIEDGTEEPQIEEPQDTTPEPTPVEGDESVLESHIFGAPERKSIGLRPIPEAVPDESLQTIVSTKAQELIDESKHRAGSEVAEITEASDEVVNTPKPVITRQPPPIKPVNKKPRRRQSSFQPAKRAKRLDRSRHMEYKYEVRRVLEEIGVPEEHRSSILGSIWAKGERQTVSDAKEYLEDKLSEGIISEGHVSKLCEVIDDYTVRR